LLDLAPSEQAWAGALLGAAHYLSPEQAEGRPANLPSDIYSLGAVFYEMITGNVPFDGESLADVIKGHVSGAVTTPSRRTPGAGIDGRIDALVLRCLKKNPSLRFSSTGELCGALDACVTDCAFLRDAHRLPGIKESGIDLTEASRRTATGPRPPAVPASARREPPAVGKKPAEPATATAPTTGESAVAAAVPPPLPSARAHRPTGAALPPPLVELTPEPVAEVPDQPADERGPSACFETRSASPWRLRAASASSFVVGIRRVFRLLSPRGPRLLARQGSVRSLETGSRTKIGAQAFLWACWPSGACGVRSDVCALGPRCRRYS